MDPTKLKQFVALAKTLNFHNAAHQSNVSPSTLSRVIQQLEEDLGVLLFFRDNRSVELTHHGQRFLEYAHDTLQQLQSLREEFLDKSSFLKGSISIYCSVTASYSFLHDLLAVFRQDQPFIELTIHTGDPALSVSRIIAGGEDVAIAAKQSVMPGSVHFKEICVSSLTLIKPIATTSQLKGDWHSIPFIIAEQGVTRERLFDWFRAKGITPNIYAQVAGHEAIVSMVSLGFGIGLVPQIVLENSPLASRVEAVSQPWDFGIYQVGLCVLEKRLKNPIIREFWSSIGQNETGQTEN